ncbi:hypothetical protein IAT40_005812 [Kwoniella sp. CBS 6097]
MSVSESTFTALKDMGIEPRLAREAASRYHNVEPAVNWCFGDGADWTPEPSRPDPSPSYNSFTPQNAEGTSVEHREVIDVDTPPITDPSPEPPYTHLASNNPFRNPYQQGPVTATVDSQPYQSSHLQTHKPPLPARPLPITGTAHQQPLLSTTPTPSYTPTIVDDDENDEELRKAIALSQADMGRSEGTIGGEPMNEDQKRSERERSVRANGPPPPSPDGDNDLGENRDAAGRGGDIQPLFGPSSKTDEDGKMALVPSTQNNTTMSKEDEDMDRAIQESLMTASFHSASAIKDSERPQPVDRPEGAPLIFWSESGHSTYAANFLQAMYAVPQLREAVEDVLNTEGASPPSYGGVQLFQLHEMAKMNRKSFVEVDDILRVLRGGREPGQLPPGQATKDFHSTIAHEMTTMILTKTGAAPDPNDWKAIAEDSQRLMKTEVDGEPPHRSTHVIFQRKQNTPSDIYSHLADLIWDSDMSGQGIIELGDILTVFIDWAYGAPRNVWRLDERVVLDRYLKSNAAYAAQKRAHQSVMAGDARRMREKIDNMTMHEGQNYHASLKTLIEHLGSSPPSDDAMQNESRREMKEKLEKILAVLERKVGEYNAELKTIEEAASSAGAFETDDPEYNKHVYTLRSILFHDGALVGGNHLFAYIKDEQGGWLKVQEHEAERVEWDTIARDKTGLWMDGGPYMLLYSREGPRPQQQETDDPSQSEKDSVVGLGQMHEMNENQARKEENLIDIDDDNNNDQNVNADVDMADPSPCPTPPSGLTEASTITARTRTGTGTNQSGDKGKGKDNDSNTEGERTDSVAAEEGKSASGQAGAGAGSGTDRKTEQDEDLIML